MSTQAFPSSSRISRLAARSRVALCRFAALAALFTPLNAEWSEAADKRPNVLLLLADDLGFSDLGCYGGEIDTPHLDQLANDGMRLTQFYTMGRCCPSRASLLTGQYPHRVGLGHMTKDMGQAGYRGRVAEGATTLAEALRTLGYRSFLSGKWHLGTEDPTTHGFEEFYGTLVSAKTFWDADHFLRLPAERTAKRYAAGEFYATDAVADHALEFLSLAGQTPHQPWFLYVAFNAPHFPLHAPPEAIAKYAQRYHGGWDKLRRQRFKRMQSLGIVSPSARLSQRSPYFDWGASRAEGTPAWETLPADRRADLARRMAIYAAMVDRLDQNVGRILDRLKSQNELQNTLIVFTSDNGACAEWDPFGFDITSGPENVLHRGDELNHMGSAGSYHSVGAGWAGASNTPWRLYKHYSHEGGLSVPCIVRWPAGMNVGLTRERPTGTIDSTPAHLIDLMPTILAATGSESTGIDVSELPGQSLLPILSRQSLPPRKLFFEHEGNRAVRDGRWKLVALRGQPWELYDMWLDRSESHDLAEAHPDTVKRLSVAWEAWAEETQVTPLPNSYGVGYLPEER